MATSDTYKQTGGTLDTAVDIVDGRAYPRARISHDVNGTPVDVGVDNPLPIDDAAIGRTLDRMVDQLVAIKRHLEIINGVEL